MYYKKLLKQWFVSSSTVLRTRDILLNLKTIPLHLVMVWVVRDYMKSIFPLVLYSQQRSLPLLQPVS